MKIYSVYNIKGGVGKTTTSVNLAYLSASAGARSMIWDLDPQGGTSYYLCVKPKVKGGAKGLIRKKPAFDDLLKMTGYPNLDLLPADISYRNMDQFLEREDKPTHGLHRILRPLRHQYDNIFLDCPPGLTTITENVFRVTDVLLVPLIPTPLSLRAYNRLVQFLVKRRTKKLQVIPFFNMVNTTKPIHRIVTKNVHAKHPIFLRNTIPESTIIEAMGIKRSPIFTYARESDEADSFRGLWKEIQQRENSKKRKKKTD
ncbi:MAG: ParA family protein [Magnetococcales bacterium]|nr:ParA family protein [Magnetococcales bacterium]